MALIVETGSVVSGAESYVAVAEADTYWLNRNNATWGAASPTAKEAALREAAQFLDASYNWLGGRINTTQPMYWPRTAYEGNDGESIPANSIPQALKNAQCELALEALAGRLDETLDRAGMVKSQQLGSLSVTYMDGAPGGKKYPFIDKLVRSLHTGAAYGGVFGEAQRG